MVSKELMTRKRKVLVVLLLLCISFTFFALDLKQAEDYYKSFFENPSPYGSYIKKLIYNDLPLYRFFKIYMVGSTEKSETTKRTGDYLINLKPFDGVGTDEEKLARAIYLTYWEAKLNNRTIDVEIIKNSPIFNEFFSNYQIRVSDAFRNYTQDLVAYLLGVNVPLDLIPEKLKSLRKEVIKNFGYQPVYNNEEKEAISILLARPEVIDAVQEIIVDAQNNSSSLDDESLIFRTSASVFRSSFQYIAGLKDEISTKFVEITPKERKYSWIRWAIYVPFFALWYFLFKDISLPFTLFVASETVYIASFMDIQSTVNGMLYGSLFAVATLFSIIHFILKKKYTYAFIALLAIITLFIPSFSTSDVIMNNTFSNSPFYSALVQDVIKDPLGKIQRYAKDFNTTVSESIQSFTTLLSDLQEDGNVSEEYFIPENFSKRIEYAKSLKSRHERMAKEIDDFVYFESVRMKKVISIRKHMEKLLKSISSISSNDFRKDLGDFVLKNFSEQISQQLLSIINSTPHRNAVFLPGYKIENYLISTMLLSLALFLTALNLQEAFIPLMGSIAVSVLSLLKYQTLFVQAGVPPITIFVNWAIPYVLVLSVMFGFLWLKAYNTFRRREKV
ncbi:MAG: hypothetical protein ACP5PP_01260 [Fervidobacterium sp.]